MPSYDSILRPPSKELALALAIVRSKPAEASLHEHILELRKTIIEGRRQLSTNSIHKYIDAVAFWKYSSHKAEAGQTKLRLRIEELERANDDLRSKVKPTKGNRVKSGRGGRQTPNAEPGTAVTDWLGWAAEVYRDPNRSHTQFGLAGQELSGNAAEKALFMRHLYCFNRLIQDERPDKGNLEARLLWHCSAMASLISSIDDTLQRANEPMHVTAIPEALGDRVLPSDRQMTNSELDTTFRALGRAFTLLLRGFDKLNNINQNHDHQAKVIYSFVKLFADILSGVEKVSIRRSEARLRKTIRAHGGHGQYEALRQSETDPAQQQVDLCDYLCQTLVAMTASLEPAKPGHNDILEGFLCLLLHRTGQRLYVFTFEDGTQETVSQSNGDRLQSHNIAADHRKAVASAAMHEEAKHLIWTLKQVLTLVREQQTGRQPNPSNPPDKNDLEETTRTRLQYTLLQGIFGADEKEFRDGFRMPDVAEPDVDVEMQTVSEDDTKQWFQQELWTLFGWEVLGRHLDIADSGLSHKS